MARLLSITCILISCCCLIESRASEYQLDSETLSQCELLRGVAVARQQGEVPHCTHDGSFSGRGQCWCVDAAGQEVVGTRTGSSALHCPSPCRQQSALRCSPAGLFEEVQCDASRRQCWCVDQEGEELYGTREDGTPQRCPGSCEVRFPEAFDTFTSFRKVFPTVSSYCFCADSRGREQENTGVELLLTEVYDSVFSGRRSGRSFSQSNVYRILQRRQLGVRLALTGHFRCPSPCETELRAAMAASSVYLPSCEGGGAFSPRQCGGGQCWCSDPEGREVPCSPPRSDCLSQRRLVFSRLFSGPAPPPSMRPPPPPCLPLPPLQTRDEDPSSLLSLMGEVLQGVFPSVGEALSALSLSSPPRLQETLFGGRFLQNISGGVGVGGVVVGEGLSPDSGGRVQTVIRALKDPNFLSNLQEVLRSSSQSEASLQQVLSPVLRSCSRGSSPLFVPRCSPGGDFLPLQCGGGRTISAGPAGGAVTCPERATQEPPSSEDDRPVSWCGENETLSKQKTKHLMKDFPNLLPGAHRALISRCSRALDDVTVFRQEVQSIINLSNSSHLPLGYGFLLAHGLQLTPEELQTGQSEKELLVSERLLSRSDAALRLAAFSTLQMLLPPLRRSYQLFSPQCDSDGDWLHTQCHHSTGQCWCVDEDGEYIADSLTSRSLHLPKCSLAALWLDERILNFSLPTTCEEKGGADGWCVNPRTGETLQTATQSAAGQLTCPSWCELQGSQCRPDGSFIPLQCDVTSCWCVSEDGQEVGGTRTSRQTGRTPSCPLCPNSITHGALLCRPAAEGRQSCDLVCHRGYHNSLPVGSFLCDSEGQRWTGDPPLSGACQISSSQLWLLSLSCSQISRLKPLLFTMMTSRGLCSAQCVGDDAMKLTFRWSSALTDLPTSDLPDLHHAGLFLNESRLLEGVQGLLGNIRSMFTSEPKLVSMTTPNYGCSHGYRLANDGEGCVVCPAGSLSSEGACLQCPQGTYQDEEGRDFCNKCPRGSSLSGASSPDFLSGRWRCVSSEGAELQWTNREEPLTDNQCSDLIVGAEDAEVLKTMTSDLTSCLVQRSRPATMWRCSTHRLSTQGFLGNPEAELFDWLSCSLRVRGGASDLLVVRKKEFSPLRYERVRMRKALSGVFRTQVFRRTSLSDALLFCSDGCSADACCHGFTLNLNTLQGGSLLCGWLRAPSVLMCGDEDWDVIGQAAANRECGAGLTYNEQQRSFLFDFGGQQFDITDSALPADSKNKTDYKASIVRFQAVYLNTVQQMQQLVLLPVQQQNRHLLWTEEVLVDPQRKPPSLSFWLNKRNYDSQQALLWCLSPACRPLLDRAPNNTYSKKGSGSVSGVVMRILVAVASASLGVQTCSEDDSTSWRTQDCRASDIRTRPEPLGWYQKPVNQWTSSPALCPPFNLPETTNNVSLDQWRLLSGSSLLVDSSLSTYDIIHLSRDIAAGNRDATRDWCLHACQEAESCVGVALSEEGGATRCVLYPETSTCGLSSAPNAPSPASSCRLVIREPASQVYLKTERLPLVTSVSIPGHGILRGVAVETSVGSDRRTVVQFLGVPYARPPIGSLRFEAAQAADWTGTWNATEPREDCLYLNIYSPAARRGRVPVLVFFFNPPANQKPRLLDGSALAALGNIVVVTVAYRTAALGFLSTGESGLRGNYGLSDQEAGLLWVHAHISAVGGDSSQVTVGGERRGADITSLLLLSSSSTPLFQRMMLMTKVGSSLLLRVDLLLGTSAEDGLISRARRIKDFESLRGRTDGRSLFYEALSRSLGGPTGSELLKEAASWFYSLDHDEASGYSVFSRALNNATRDLFIICPALQMASLWANSKANVYLYHQPASSSRADVSVPLDVQLVFGTPHQPISSQRFTPSERRLSVAAMSYVSSFVRTGNPNPSPLWAESALPQWKQVSEAPPTYLQLSPALLNQRGLSQSACSFWGGLGARLLGATGAELWSISDLSLAAPSSQSQSEKDTYS
ncbi:Thyroglobulin [Dissostichus eleginoides]|uniref:Thyroglobulin n=1 Tax=Dissostichus eleginoides TaxID=100907 RepID=A0AAD9F7E7_DISEL|nr:Thyroglobulin [Dissostichus eleginoides]